LRESGRKGEGTLGRGGNALSNGAKFKSQRDSRREIRRGRTGFGSI